MHQLQQNMIFPNGLKPHGTIIKKSDYITHKQQTETVSQDNPLTNLATITSNNSSHKVPGQIKTVAKGIPAKIDEQVYYNADIYSSREKYKQKIDYQSIQHMSIPIKERSKSLNMQIPKIAVECRTLYSIQQQNGQKMLNIHGEFELQRYKQLSTLLKNMKLAFNQNQVQFLSNIKLYIELITTSRIAQISQIKMAESKKETIKQCFMTQRQAVIAICLTFVTKKQQKYKNYCNNLLKYIYDNYLVVLNLLTHENNPFVVKLIEQEEGGYLLGKGFGLLRTNKEVIADLINKIMKVDPLFQTEYHKIVDCLAGREVDYIFNALLTLFAFFVNALKVEHTLPFMACAAAPYLLQKSSHQYTLVIDFMRVFLSDSKPAKKQRKNKESLTLRPYSLYFIKEMAKYFEIVSYSNSMPVECNSIINAIDQNRVLQHRLYKYHFLDGKRDMSKIGRDKHKMILIDTVQDQSNKQLLQLSSWKGQANNVQLAEVCPLLALIVVKKLSTLSALHKIRETAKSNSNLGLKYINCGLDL